MLEMTAICLWSFMLLSLMNCFCSGLCEETGAVAWVGVSLVALVMLSEDCFVFNYFIASMPGLKTLDFSQNIKCDHYFDQNRLNLTKFKN